MFKSNFDNTAFARRKKNNMYVESDVVVVSFR